MRPSPPAARRAPLAPGPRAASEEAAALLLAEAQPRYASLAATLAAEILEGRRAVGELLPTEQELGQAFGVSRSTVREALRRLRELGLVAGAQGVGTRVISNRPRSSYQLAVRSVAEVMGYSDRTLLEIRGREMLAADAALAERIGCEPGSRWVRIQGLRVPEAKAPPISCVELFVAEAFAAMAERPDIVTTPAYRLIGRHMGVAVAEVRQEITAIALDAEQAAALQAAPGSPGLHIIRRFFAADGRLMEATVNVHGAADRFAYALRLGAPEGNE
jgi:DNA-binding GntR family transcriptional regulator